MSLWRFRGSPHYLDAQAQRLGLTKVLADRSRHNAEIFRIQVLAAQLCERYHRAPKVNGVPQFYAPELAQVRGTLDQIEIEVSKLHMLAAASSAIATEIATAFDLTFAPRNFGVTSRFDIPATVPPTEHAHNGISHEA
jgi:hypothetical protein